MFYPFRLRAAVARSNDLDRVDVLKTKLVLGHLGHFQEPPYGVTEYPDEPMFSALEAFQRRENLEVDGLMRPDGPTERRINQRLTSTHRPTHEGWKFLERENLEPPIEGFELALRKRGGGTGSPKRREGDCERQLAFDTAICNQVYLKKGKEAAAICQSSAMRRYSACLHGGIVPPLLTGDW